MSKPSVCPVCKSGLRVVEAPPLTRTARNGQTILVAKRLRCADCDYTDRVTMFRGGLSLTYEEYADESGRGPFPEELED